MKTQYYRTEYGELVPRDRNFEIWTIAMGMIAQAAKTKKIPSAYNSIEFDRRGRADGDAIHHEVYDIHPDPIRVLLCIRETEGTRYGVRTVQKNYVLLLRHGKGVRVKPAKKSIAAKAAKAADCELGCAINVVTGKAKLKIPRACPDGIAYKQLAIQDDGKLYSIYDGSPWTLGQPRYDRAMRDHNGGLYVYEDIMDAYNAPFPDNSALLNTGRVIVKCKVAGNYCRYGKKLAFSTVTPINIARIL